MCCKFLSVWCIRLWVLIMSHARFKVNLHSAVVWMSRKPLLLTGVISQVYVTAADPNPQPFSSWANTQPFSQTGQMIKLCCECLYAWCIRQHVLIMSHTCFRVNLLFVVAWISANFLLERRVSDMIRTPNKHFTCIPRWHDVETVVSKSFQRGIQVVCFWGTIYCTIRSKFQSKIVSLYIGLENAKAIFQCSWSLLGHVVCCWKTPAMKSVMTTVFDFVCSGIVFSFCLRL